MKIDHPSLLNSHFGSGSSSLGMENTIGLVSRAGLYPCPSFLPNKRNSVLLGIYRFSATTANLNELFQDGAVF